MFLDEVDTILGSRGDTRVPHSVQAQVLSVLLNELDGVGLKTVERRGTQRRHCESEEHPESLQEQQVRFASQLWIEGKKGPDFSILRLIYKITNITKYSL